MKMRLCCWHVASCFLGWLAGGWERLWGLQAHGNRDRRSVQHRRIVQSHSGKTRCAVCNWSFLVLRLSFKIKTSIKHPFGVWWYKTELGCVCVNYILCQEVAQQACKPVIVGHATMCTQSNPTAIIQCSFFHWSLIFWHSLPCFSHRDTRWF